MTPPARPQPIPTQKTPPIALHCPPWTATPACHSPPQGRTRPGPCQAPSSRVRRICPTPFRSPRPAVPSPPVAEVVGVTRCRGGTSPARRGNAWRPLEALRQRSPSAHTPWQRLRHQETPAREPTPAHAQRTTPCHSSRTHRRTAHRLQRCDHCAALNADASEWTATRDGFPDAVPALFVLPQFAVCACGCSRTRTGFHCVVFFGCMCVCACHLLRILNVPLSQAHGV